MKATLRLPRSATYVPGWSRYPCELRFDYSRAVRATSWLSLIVVAGCADGCGGDVATRPPSGSDQLSAEEVTAPITARPPPSPVRDVAVYGDAICALLEDHRVFCWGNDVGGSIGDGSTIGDTPEDRRRPTPVPVQGLVGPVREIGEGFALLDDGTVALWQSVLWILGAGQSHHEYRTRAEPWSLAGAGVTDLAFAQNAACTLGAGGMLRCAGDAEMLGDESTSSRVAFGPVRVPPPVAAVGAGGRRACAVGGDGRVYCWGYDDNAPRDPAPPDCWQEGERSHGHPPPGGPPPHPMPDPCAPRPHVDRAPIAIEGVTDAVDVAVGWRPFACAVVRDGRVWCWGANDPGTLGDGTRVSRMHAAPVIGLRDRVEQLAVGSYGVCVRYADGSVDCWGGHGTLQSDVPVRVPVIDDAIDLADGGDVTCVVRRSDRNVWCWGYIDAGFEPDPERAPGTPAPAVWR